MKENKNAIVWLSNIFAISLILNVLLFALNNSILQNNEQLIWLSITFDWFVCFSSAILTGAFVSLIVCIINHKTLIKKHLERIVFLTYQKDSKLYALLFNKDKKITLKNAWELDACYDLYSQEIYQIINELEESLFAFNKERRKSVNAFSQEFLIEYNFFAEFATYIHLYQEDFNSNSKTIYKILKDEIDNNGLYSKSTILARDFGCKIYSPDEFEDKNVLQKKMTKKFKVRVDNFKPEIKQ